MNRLKVIKVTDDGIIFDNNVKLTSEHEQDCCEKHYLDFNDNKEDFEDLYFDLSNDNFFNKVEGYGIELIPIKGHSVRVPGYGYNNGYYGTNINLVILDKNDKLIKSYDVTECQRIYD